MSVRMPTRRYPRKTDVARAVQAARENGIPVGSVELRPNGAIRISSSVENNRNKELDGDDFDRWNAAGRL